jgi:hypothetical protein
MVIRVRVCACHMYTNYTTIDNLLPSCHQTHASRQWQLFCKSQGRPLREGTAYRYTQTRIHFVCAREWDYIFLSHVSCPLLLHPIPPTARLTLLSRSRWSAPFTVDFHRENNPIMRKRNVENKTKVDRVTEKKKTNITITIIIWRIIK